MDGWMGGWVDGWMHGRMHRGRNGRTRGWVDGKGKKTKRSNDRGSHKKAQQRLFIRRVYKARYGKEA